MSKHGIKCQQFYNSTKNMSKYNLKSPAYGTLVTVIKLYLFKKHDD